jgi:hypothetical protein
VKVNRRLLYWGVFFLALGGVLLAAAAAAIDDEVLAQALHFWPVAVIALGLGLLLRRTRFDVAGGVMAAAMPGLLLGGLVVAAPHMAPDCADVRPAAMETLQGTFDGAASVELELACGDLSVTTTPGNAWRLEEGNARSAHATVDASADHLSITSADRDRAFDVVRGADTWRLALPTSPTLDLAAEVNAGRGRFDLAGARLGNVTIAVNAGEGRVDLAGASITRLATDVNAAKVALSLPATGDFGAELAVNAGALTVCAPVELGLRIREQVVLGSITHAGLVRVGDAWETPGYATATHHADVTISVNVGSVDVNPEGVCK